MPQCKHERAWPEYIEYCLRPEGHVGVCRFVSDPAPSLPCEDCDELRRRISELEHSLAAVQADAGRVLEERREAQADNARLREYIERVNVELHERRSTDLTDEERGALRWLRGWPQWEMKAFTERHPMATHALAILDRLLERKP